MPSKPATHAALRRANEPVYDNRPSASARGYGAAWRKLRAWYAAKHPAICSCGHAGPSREMHLDHRISRERGGADEEGNLQWLCETCHSRKTAMEDGGFGNEQSARTVVCGRPGSGKTTYVNERRAAGDVVWDFDAAVASMTGLPLYERPEALVGMFEAMRVAACEWLSRNKTTGRVWLIVSHRQKANAIAQSIGASVVILDVPADTCRDRLRSCGRLDPSRESLIGSWV